MVPAGVEVPETVGEPARAAARALRGRLSEEKGILEFLEATEGLPRVIVGDGPLRDRVPEAVGFVPPSELGAYYERAAVVCVPSRREGYGMTAREAMAYGRPVVATGVGGLADLDGTTLLVAPGDVAGCARSLEQLLAGRQCASHLGERAARLRARHSPPRPHPQSATRPTRARWSRVARGGLRYLNGVSSRAVTPPSVVIEPRRSYSLRLGELWAYRELLYFLMWRDIKVRYKQTALGAAWAVLQPLLLMVVFTIFLGQFAGRRPAGDPLPGLRLRGARPVDVLLERTRGREQTASSAVRISSRRSTSRGLLMPVAACSARSCSTS